MAQADNANPPVIFFSESSGIGIFTFITFQWNFQ